MHKYNSYFPDSATPESLTADREAMLKDIFGKVGKDVFIEPPINIDYGCNVSLGDGFYSNFKLRSFPSVPPPSPPASTLFFIFVVGGKAKVMLIPSSF